VVFNGRRRAHAQVAKLFQKQARVLADERAEIVGEANASLEKLLALISASVNRDLPKRLDDLLAKRLAAANASAASNAARAAGYESSRCALILAAPLLQRDTLQQTLAKAQHTAENPAKRPEQARTLSPD